MLFWMKEKIPLVDVREIINTIVQRREAKGWETDTGAADCKVHRFSE